MKQILRFSAICSFILTVFTSIVYIICQQGVFLTLAITFGTTAYHLLMRLLVGAVVNRVLNNRVDYRLRWFQPLSFEKNLYAHLKVRKWKKHLPTYDPTLFSTKAHSLEEIVQAMCQAEIVHEIIVVCSYFPLLATFLFGAFPVFLLTSLFASAYDFLFVILQRYNRPRMIRLIELQRKSKEIRL